jgi:hypothetical protein
MQLGQFLECEPGEPSCFEPVEFYLSRKTPTGKRRIRVRANLYPVSESERRAARKAATAYLRSTPAYAPKDGVSPPIPPEEVDFETTLHFLVRLDHILETPRMGVDGERGLQHKGQRPIQRTRSAWRRRQTCARVQCSVSVICALASVRFRPDRLFCTRCFF